MHTTQQRLEAAKRFVATQINAIRQDTEMTDQMFEVVRDSVINEFDRFVNYLLEQGRLVDYNTAFDEGYTKALEHATSRRKRLQVPTHMPPPSEGAIDASGASGKYRLARLTEIGQQIVNIPRTEWSRVRNALRQLKHRTGREYAILADESTGLMRVTLVLAPQPAPCPRNTLTQKLRKVV